MTYGYVELQDITDLVGIGGKEPIAASDNMDCEIFNDTPETYPDAVISWAGTDVPECVVNGVLLMVNILGGSVPTSVPQRPR